MELGVAKTHENDRRGFEKRPAPARSASSNSIRTRYRAPSGPSYSLFPPPDKPLPPLPLAAEKRQRSATETSSIPRLNPRPSVDGASQTSTATSDIETANYSTSSSGLSDKVLTWPRSDPLGWSRTTDDSSKLQLGLEKLLTSDDRRHGEVFFLDSWPTYDIIASKHGKDTIKIWNTVDGSVRSTVKFPAYTEAQSRSRDYLIRSHSIISEAQTLMAVTTRFGRTVEIWNWKKRKCLQTMTDADRWTTGQGAKYGHDCSALAVYRASNHTIHFYTMGPDAKKLTEKRKLDLRQARLPFLPQYPELAMSTNSSLLVAAAGPRPPRLGHPPPDKETLLVAWETDKEGAVSIKPFKVVRPWQHDEISTAVPCQLAVHDKTAVSIWIPATFRAVASSSSRGGTGYHLAHVSVPYRHILVWDLSDSSTRTFAIPNCLACISPDCRYVAYCHASGAEIGARGIVSVLDVRDGSEVWSWPDKDALAINFAPTAGFGQFDDLGSVTDLSFAGDSKSLLVGDRTGRVGIYRFQGGASGPRNSG
ncbi:hypothetical protein HIM_00737 [Hirsutella minnesotensis 3608]|nr:hypothetical protein HIM_00737 [Hirsutella minnesotensis 3608]